MKTKDIENAYQLAKERYAEAGVSVDSALKRLSAISISMQCWQADDVGGFASNMDLSKRRAESVIATLAGQYRVDRQRLTPVGVSFASPVAPNANEDGRAKNRRVELVPNK